jgi:hypothetical protein
MRISHRNFIIGARDYHIITSKAIDFISFTKTAHSCASVYAGMGDLHAG